jgi:hypothetical protein
MGEYTATESDRQVSGWAVGGVAFAATVLLMVGAFQMVAGIVALFDEQFFVLAPNYTFAIDTTGWGWIHLVIGLFLIIVALALFMQQQWAAMAAIFLAVISAVANFFFIPYYPFWALLLIGLDVWVIWSLTRPGVLQA